MGVLADLEVGEDLRLGADGREFVVGGEGDVDFVADVAGLDDEAHGEDFDHSAAQEGDHPREINGAGAGVVDDGRALEESQRPRQAACVIFRRFRSQGVSS